ncbi:hypothetical protein LTR85_008650 [Meristemomyces frigidus]|nr:hypothetical protein LTR85_008650 [Meristemomyces frigidus]
MAARTVPPMNAPASSVTVKVSAIDTTLRVGGMQANFLWKEKIEGFDNFKFGTWSLLIEHPSGRKLLYDLGARKDWENVAPGVGLKQMVDAGVVQGRSVERNVAEILTDGGVDLHDIEGIIWSHYHFDHTGDVSTFPTSTKLVVGPGTKANYLPGYPADPSAKTLASDFEGREVQEADFSGAVLQIGRFKSIDYFGDGSFFLLDSPDHAIGHINALARTHVSPSPGFIHMCGDSAHHPAEIRPSEYVPLPDTIEPSPVPRLHPNTCPGHVFSAILHNASKTQPILTFHDPFSERISDAKYRMIVDESQLRDTLIKNEEFHGAQDVFTVLAHDWSLKGVIDEWPKSLNAWKEQVWKASTHWKFLEDFEKASGGS